jgi:hypothetical protein
MTFASLDRRIQERKYAFALLSKMLAHAQCKTYNKVAIRKNSLHSKFLRTKVRFDVNQRE